MMEWLTPEVVETWLEWAGIRLVALPGSKIKPAQPKVLWPDYSTDLFQLLEFRNASAPPRASGPTKEEIPIMDLILLLPNLCADVRVRRVLHSRALLHPLTQRHLYTWTRIAQRIQSNRETTRLLYKKGLVEVGKKAQPDVVCRIREFFLEAA